MDSAEMNSPSPTMEAMKMIDAAIEQQERAPQRDVEDHDGGKDIETDMHEPDHHRRQELADQDLMRPEGRDHQLIEGAELALAGNRQGGDDEPNQQGDASR